MIDTALIVGCIAGAVALASTGANVINARALERIKSSSEAAKTAAAERKELSIYSESLARSAFDLQSRLYNILRQEALKAYLDQGSQRAQVYLIENTIFLVSQYMCWVELTRQEINFIQLRDEISTKRLLRTQDDIYAVWGTDTFPDAFRIFAGEQRALGEALIVGEPEFTTCMGYGRFLEKLGSGNNSIVDHLRREMENLPMSIDAARERLTAVQHLLVDVILIIDTGSLRFPVSRLSKA